MLFAIAFTIWCALSLIGLIQLDRWLEDCIGAWAAWSFVMLLAVLWFVVWWGAR